LLRLPAPHGAAWEAAAAAPAPPPAPPRLLLPPLAAQELLLPAFEALSPAPAPLAFGGADGDGPVLVMTSPTCFADGSELPMQLLSFQ
jgi:hypothetical protein